MFSFSSIVLSLFTVQHFGAVPAILKCFVNKVGLNFPSWENETALEIMSQTVFDVLSCLTIFASVV